MPKGSATTTKHRNLTCSFCRRTDNEQKFVALSTYGPSEDCRVQPYLCRGCNNKIAAISAKLFDQLGDWSSARTEAERRYRELNGYYQQGEDPAAASKRGGGGRGQGYATDKASIDAVDAYAVKVALEYYNGKGDTISVGDEKTWDLECRVSPDELRHVEVKGQQSDERGTVHLLPTQVSHYCEYPQVALFVVYGVVLVRGDDGVPVAVEHAGEWKYDPWLLDPKDLTATKFDYTLPA